MMSGDAISKGVMGVDRLRHTSYIFFHICPFHENDLLNGSLNTYMRGYAAQGRPVLVQAGRCIIFSPSLIDRKSSHKKATLCVEIVLQSNQNGTQPVII